MRTIRRQVHGVPYWLMQEYLQELGGEIQEEGLVFGDGWEARFERVEDYRIGSLVIGAICLEVKGNEATLANLEPVLNLKLMRGGG